MIEGALEKATHLVVVRTAVQCTQVCTGLVCATALLLHGNWLAASVIIGFAIGCSF